MGRGYDLNIGVHNDGRGWRGMPGIAFLFAFYIEIHPLLARIRSWELLKGTKWSGRLST
jgi:hypothetical protein